jgi:hypothetical protein
MKIIRILEMYHLKTEHFFTQRLLPAEHRRAPALQRTHAFTAQLFHPTLAFS